MPVLWCGVHAEDHLPGAMRIMLGGIRVHIVAQIGGVGDKSIDERNQSPVNGGGACSRCLGIVSCVVNHQPEAIGVHHQTFAQLVGARSLGGGETGGFDRRDCLQIVQGGMADQHADGLSISMIFN